MLIKTPFLKIACRETSVWSVHATEGLLSKEGPKALPWRGSHVIKKKKIVENTKLYSRII